MMHDWIHPVSVLIVGELKAEEKTAAELSKDLELPYNLVYRRLKKLESAGLVSRGEKKKGITFSLNLRDPAVRCLLRFREVLKFREVLQIANPRVRAAAIEVIETFEEKFPDLAVDLFFYGSFAKGTSRRGSDVDALVVVPEERVKEVEKEIADIITAHVFVMDRKMFEEKTREAGPYVRSVLAGIHLKLPL